MGKAKVRKKLGGYEKQLRKHIGKFKEAESRGDIGSMNYMAKEMDNYIKRMSKLNLRLLPKSPKKKKKLISAKPA